MAVDNRSIAVKLAEMEQYKLDRIVKLRDWGMSLEQIEGRTGHTTKLIKTYLISVGKWEKHKKKPTLSRKTGTGRHSEIYSR